MPAPVPSSPQTLGHYVLRRKLGEGASGEVWLAHDKALDREVAVKIMRAQAATTEGSIREFVREAQATAKLNHPNTVTIFQIAKQGEGKARRVFIAMEYVEAGSLADELRDKGAMPWREATQAIRDAAAGLQAAHEAGLIHRDVKPSNLMRSRRGIVKVVDFGLAKNRRMDSEMTQTMAGTLLGSPAYMSPEQCRGETADARSDLYSLICSYYQLLTRQHPFPSSDFAAAIYGHCHQPFPDARAYAPDLPDAVCLILAKGSAKNPQERYQTAGELIAAMDALLHTPEVSHTYGAKLTGATSKVGKEPRDRLIISILKGKGFMGKTAWAAAIAAIIGVSIVSLRHGLADHTAGHAVSSARNAVPTVGQQAKSERMLKDVFKARYALPDPASRAGLASTFIEQGVQTDNDPSAKYVLFREARDLAASAGDWPTSFRAADEMAKAFPVNALDMKTTGLIAAAPHTESKEANTALTHAGIDLIDAAIAANDEPIELRLLPVLETSARKTQSPVVMADAHAQGPRTRAATTLRLHPDDPNANEIEGRWLCLNRGEWARGLKMLAKGSELDLKELAEKELAAPETATARLQRADAWWDFAEKQGEPARENVERHAGELYAIARPELRGVDAARADARASKLPVAATATVTNNVANNSVPVVPPPTPTPKVMSSGSAGLPPVTSIPPDTKAPGKLTVLSTTSDYPAPLYYLQFAEHSPRLNAGARVVGQPAGRIRVSVMPSGKQLIEQEGFWGHLSPDGQVLSCAASLWSVETGKSIANFNPAPGYPYIPDQTLSADGTRFAMLRTGNRGEPDSSIMYLFIGDGKTGKIIKQITSWSVDSPQCLEFSPNGRQIAVGPNNYRDYAVELWDLATDQKLWRTEVGKHRARHVRFSRDGSRIYTVPLAVDSNKTVYVLDTKTGNEIAACTDDKDVNAVEITADGQWLLTASDDAVSLKLWDLKSGNDSERFSKVTGTCTSAVFTPDNRRVFAGFADGTVRIYDVATARELDRAPGHKGPVRAVAVSPDGKLAASGGEDESVRIWRFPS